MSAQPARHLIALRATAGVQTAPGDTTEIVRSLRRSGSVDNAEIDGLRLNFRRFEIAPDAQRIAHRAANSARGQSHYHCLTGTIEHRKLEANEALADDDGSVPSPPKIRWRRPRWKGGQSLQSTRLESCLKRLQVSRRSSQPEDDRGAHGLNIRHCGGSTDFCDYGHMPSGARLGRAGAPVPHKHASALTISQTFLHKSTRSFFILSCSAGRCTPCVPNRRSHTKRSGETSRPGSGGPSSSSRRRRVWQDRNAFHHQNLHIRILDHGRAQTARRAGEAFLGAAPFPVAGSRARLRRKRDRACRLVVQFGAQVVVESRSVRRQNRRAGRVVTALIPRIRTVKRPSSLPVTSFWSSSSSRSKVGTSMRRSCASITSGRSPVYRASCSTILWRSSALNVSPLPSASA